MLTEKQHKLLSFITTKISKNGVSPSFDEMRQALDLKEILTIKWYIPKNKNKGKPKETFANAK